MKKIISRSITLAILGGWTVLAIASSERHGISCRHEWNTAFSSGKASNLAVTEDMPDNEEKQSRVEIFLPGALNNLLFQ
jgi:hypothetical protein